MRKKVDERIITLIENGVKTRHRSMFIIVGDKAIHQIANLHHLMGKAALDKPKAGSDNKSPRTVLWCYKDKLDFSSHEKKRAKQIEKKIQRGLFEPDKADVFALFLKCVKMTHCRYKDSEKVLGNTYGMCILQDFEALTPNLLARTLETVEGGGLIVLLLRSLPSLTSLYTMTMDVHERFRTESHKDKATGRFNERFLLSLASCKACIVMDDELNILPISSHIRSIKPTSVVKDAVGLSETQSDSKNLREQLNDDDPVGPVIKKCGTVDQCKNDDQGLPETQRDLTSLNEQLDGAYPVGPLIRKCCTFDQGKSVITFLDAILDKTLRSTIALLSARGRGKSAALGLAIAGAIASGYSNIYVTAPSPDNVKTLFEFVCKGFNALDYKESADYQVVKSSNSEFKQAIVRLDIYKQHRQTIQYIQPNEHVKLSQVELLVIDEAAAIPLPVVKSMLGPYLVFLSSTVNGYEGTGRSLSLKLLQQLQQQSQTPNTTVDDALSGRVFKKVELSESIRYASGDPVESWLYNLLCLGATSSIPNINRLPPTNECDLYYVDRDTLFSYHNKSELFLQRMMALYVASHYKNSPNDLQLMADAPAHHLFVLLGPVDESRNDLPDILCVLQVCLEGQISLGSAIKSLSEGHSPSGDQIPWKFCEQFQETYFPSLSGARIVRIAVHPSAMRLGYGSTAVELLTRYYEGQFTPIAEVDVEEAVEKPVLKPLSEAAKETSLLKEDIKPRANLPPLLVHLRERKPERLNYIGVSFGLTIDLFRFWSKHKFMPFYVGHIPSTTTGEHTCMGIKPFSSDDVSVGGSSLGDFLSQFYRDFRRRFTRLLCSSFQGIEYKLAMSILDPKINFREHEPASSPSNGFLTPINDILSPLDKKRLKAYADNLVDFHMILDLVPILAHQYFEEKFPVTLSYVQASLLLCMGLQNHDVTYVEGQMKLERQQILSLFIKVMRKFSKCLYDTASKEIESNFSRRRDVVMEPLSVSLDEDLNEGARQVMEKMRAETKGSMNPDLLQQYAIRDEEGNFEKALQNGEVKIPASGLISVKTNRNKVEKHGKQKDHKRNDKRSRDGSESHSTKKKKS